MVSCRATFLTEYEESELIDCPPLYQLSQVCRSYLLFLATYNIVAYIYALLLKALLAVCMKYTAQDES